MKGKRIRVSGFAETALIKALGGQSMTPPWGDTYGAMEKGALDGFYGAFTSATGYSFQEVAKFACGPPVNEQALKAVWMRLDAFTKLPQNLQTVMIEAAREIEVQYMAVNEKEVEDSKKICIAAGMKIIDFSAEESAKYRQMFNDISWEAVQKDRPELLPKLKQLIEGKK